jgi:hypothetical protein
MLMYEGDPQSVEQAIAILPKEARPIVKQLAPEAFAAHSQQIHGTTTPPRSTEAGYRRNTQVTDSARAVFVGED